MLRLESETGWWLVTHVDHAQLAGAFAAQWGNDLFLAPEPRAHVLRGIATHDDGWAARDQQPHITRQGKPSAFSVELVGKYSAFEEIDLADYLAVRERAVHMVAEEDAYAALLVSMHTYNLLTARADRSTIQPEQLPLLDAFLERQLQFQRELKGRLAIDKDLAPEEVLPARIENHFRLLQATDNLSLLGCVDYSQRADLLHALPLRAGGESRVAVESLGERNFRLAPYPFVTSPLVFTLPARHVEGKLFGSAEELRKQFHQAPKVLLPVTVSGDKAPGQK
jgi:Protein of unknown function (DUF3891)